MGNRIDWRSILGGGSEASWDADRKRKLGRIDNETAGIFRVGELLMREGASVECTPDVLRRHPETAWWYVALAGYSSKTLKNLGARAREYGLSIAPSTFLDKMEAAPATVSESDRRAFAKWINAELADRDTPIPAEHAAVRVAMIAGGRVIGQGQNEGGDESVALLKSALVAAFPTIAWEYEAEGSWHPVTGSPAIAAAADFWRVAGTDVLLDFRHGGNRPDITISKRRVVTLVGEIKGRKDLSNAWESWMPQVADHMRSWKRQFPDALRGVFMTVITDPMVTGQSSQGRARRTGLRELHDAGLLDFAVNISLLHAIKEGDRNLAQFRDVIAAAIKRGRSSGGTIPK